MLREVLAGSGGRVLLRLHDPHLQTLESRALKRGEAGFSVEEAIDILIAPICYRILFANGEISPDYVNRLLARFAVE